jgi:hypothetical protein
MSIIATPEDTLSKLKVTTLDLNCLAIHQSISQLSPSRFQYPMESRSGNTHLLRALLLFQPL